MERNWETIREILFAAESIEPDKTLTLSDFSLDRAHEISYQILILQEAGYIDALISKTLARGPRNFHLHRLTWPGHELLDAIRDESIWDKTKSTISSKGVSMTFELVMSVAAQLAKQALGLR
ncbi:MAG: DUF2513 domain-containing protein [Bacteroidetes bacterium]|nr:DUF2513 domain-containing protein [Bacteroidota bacterium]